MNIKALFAGAAIAAIATSAFAATTHHRHATAPSAGAYAAPSQPVAYGELNSYLRASPHARAAKDWSTAAATGSSVNASAIAPAPAQPAAPAADTTAGAAPAVPPPAAVPEAAAPTNGQTPPAPSATPAPATNAPPTGSAVNPPPATQPAP